MSPSKWITIRNTQAPGKLYRVDGSPTKTYTQEDVYFKMWIPVVNLSKFTLLLGPQYKMAVVLALFLAVLMFRPQGLMGKA